MTKKEFVERIRNNYPIPECIFIPAPILARESNEKLKAYIEYWTKELEKSNRMVNRLKKDS